MATRKRTANSTRIAPAIESPVVKAPRAPRERPCECQCGQMTDGGTWKPGHDATHKSKLLRAYDAGNESAGSELVERGWYTSDRLVARGQKADSSDAAKAERMLAKADKLAERIDDLNQRRDALLAERKALLAETTEPDQAETTGPVEEVTS